MYYLLVCKLVTRHYLLYSSWMTVIQELLINDSLTMKSSVSLSSFERSVYQQELTNHA